MFSSFLTLHALLSLLVQAASFYSSAPSQFDTEISKINIDEISNRYDEIVHVISQASFFAIDAEFGGITQPREDRYFDMLEDRYASVKKAVETYPLFQLGISCLVNESLITYSFLVLPSEDRFTVSIKSMKYLAENGFDFNLLFLTGIPSGRTSSPATESYDSILKSNQPAKKEMIAILVNLMMKSKKPIVTHNGLFDLMHLVDKFVMPLPATLRDFKQLWMRIPIFDSKFMASSLLKLPDPRDTTLEKLSAEFELDDGQTSFHDAGCDALITGGLFLHFLQYFFQSNLDTVMKDKTMANQIYITKSDFPSWNLRIIMQLVNRSSVFHLQTAVSSDSIFATMRNLIEVIDKDPLNPESMLIKLPDVRCVDQLKQFGTVTPYTAKRN